MKNDKGWVKTAEIIDTDVLVIGGGLAGSFAAINAAKQGPKVLLVTKGLLGHSGCSIGAAFLAAMPIYTPPDSLEGRIKELTKTCNNLLLDEEIKLNTLKKASQLSRELEELGMYFRRHDDGSLVHLRSSDSPHSTALIGTKTDTGRTIMKNVRNEIIRRKIPFLEETAATSFVVEDGEAVGATFLNYAKGKFLVVRAKATILATGSNGYVWSYFTGTRENTGDGIVMAGKVGADLVNLEMLRWHMIDIAGPYSMRRLNLSFGFVDSPTGRTIWVNKEGKAFLNAHDPLSEIFQTKAAAKQVREGLAEWRGKYYAVLKHLNPEIEQKYNSNYSILKKLGYDPTKDVIECGFTVHTMIGGIQVNSRMETGVHGLYSAGSINYSMWNLLDCLYSGKISGEEASKRASRIRKIELNWQQVESEEERVFGCLRVKEHADSPSPTQVKRNIRILMDEKMWFIKKEETMNGCLEGLRRIRKEVLPKMGLVSDTRNFNYEWLETLEVVNMLDFAELLVHASLLRKESRASFQREDYPETDNVNQLLTVVRFEDGKMKTFTVPRERQIKESDQYGDGKSKS